MLTHPLTHPLTMAICNDPVVMPLKSGAIDLGRLKLSQIEVVPITTAMRQMVRGLEFDICEMAYITYLSARAYGKPLTALPIVVTRNFHHGAAFTAAASGIKTPKDLEGRRVAVNRGFTNTTGAWVRGILTSEYGVDLTNITWVPTDEENVAEFVDPANVDPTCRGRSAEDLLLSGDCAAAVGDVRPKSPEVRPLIEDARQTGFDYYRRTGIYPINHMIVVRSDLLEQHPWLARELYAAFVRSRDAYYTRLRSGAADSRKDQGPAEVERALGIEAFPQGFEPNRKALEAITAYAYEQRIINKPMRIDELFASVE